MLELSVVIIAQNEAATIGDALDSVAWANDLVVVDSGSTDDTMAIARRHTNRVVSHTWEGYGAQKNYATSLATHDWVLSLDADERVSAALAGEIQTLFTAGPRLHGYRIPRTTFYLGQWIRTTDWYPDHQLRLYDRRVSRWTTPLVHESVTVDGRVGELTGEIHHLAYRDISHHLATIDRYTSLAARQMLTDGRRVSGVSLATRPPLAFLRNYIARQGIRQGRAGLVVSVMNSYYVFLKFAKLWEAQRARSDRTPE